MIRWITDAKIALTSLRATRMRTGLTIVGIVIGVAAMTAVLAIGEGAKNNLRTQAATVGNDMVTIRPGKSVRDAVGNILNYNYLAAFSASTLTEHDLDTVAKTPGVQHAAPFMLVTGSVSADEKKADVHAIIGTTPSAESTLGLRLRAGQFITPGLIRQTAVVGQNLAIQLFGSDVAIGRTIMLRGQAFTVIGILDHFDSSATVSNLFDLNQAVFIPLDAGKAFNQGIAQIQQINLRTDDPTTNQRLRDALLANHGGEEDFSVLRPDETLAVTDYIFKLLTSLIAAVASISIVVGGVGIMNIMLVSVTERTREIGIRKAVGATNIQILSQFLIESLMMSLTGGVFGIGIGYALAFAAGTLLNFMPGVTWQIIGTSVAVTLLTGILFGAWPAIKAARKDPIEALRYFQ